MNLADGLVVTREKDYARMKLYVQSSVFHHTHPIHFNAHTGP